MDANPMVSIPLALGIMLIIPLAVLVGIVLERRLSALSPHPVGRRSWCLLVNEWIGVTLQEFPSLAFLSKDLRES